MPKNEQRKFVSNEGYNQRFTQVAIRPTVHGRVASLLRTSTQAYDEPSFRAVQRYPSGTSIPTAIAIPSNAEFGTFRDAVRVQVVPSEHMIQELVQGKLEEFQDLGYIGHLEPVQFDGESLTATAYIPREHWNRQDRQRILSALTDLEDEHDITVEVRLTREREHAPGE